MHKAIDIHRWHLCHVKEHGENEVPVWALLTDWNRRPKNNSCQREMCLAPKLILPLKNYIIIM